MPRPSVSVNELAMAARQRHRGYLHCAVAVTALGCLGFFGDTFNPALEYNRAAIASGQWWRLLSGHLVHLNIVHSALNVLGVVLCLLVFGAPRASFSGLLGLLAVSLCTGLGLWFLSPDVEYYLGFFGVLHGILAYALTSTVNRPWHALGLLGVAIKLAYEQVSHFNPLYLQSSIGDAVVVDAHLYGALSGALLALLACWQRRHSSVSAESPSTPDAPPRK